LEFFEKILECSFDYVIVLASDEKETRVLSTLSGNSEASSAPYLYARARYMLVYLFRQVTKNFEKLFCALQGLVCNMDQNLILITVTSGLNICKMVQKAELKSSCISF